MPRASRTPKLFFVGIALQSLGRVGDIRGLADVASSRRVLAGGQLLCTPALQKPHWSWAPISIHFTRRPSIFDGPGFACLGGVVAGAANTCRNVGFFADRCGPTLSPHFNAWYSSRSGNLAPAHAAHCAVRRSWPKCLTARKLEHVYLRRALPSHPQH